MSVHDEKVSQVTVRTLVQMKQAGEKLACLTAYDASFAAVLDQAGVDIILVGDSLGNVVQGHKSTLPVTMDDMIYHTAAVSRGCSRALLMADMPFMSYSSVEAALRNATRFMSEAGAHMVKLECGPVHAEIVDRLVNEGIPVCAHLGLRPQAVHQLGGYRVQGRDADTAKQMLQEAKTLVELGASAILLELVPASLAAEISESVEVPVIGIGAGAACDAQVLVLYDILGITLGKTPKFSKNFLADTNSIQTAIEAYVVAVKNGQFPSEEHTFL